MASKLKRYLRAHRRQPDGSEVGPTTEKVILASTLVGTLGTIYGLAYWYFQG